VHPSHRYKVNASHQLEGSGLSFGKEAAIYSLLCS